MALGPFSLQVARRGFDSCCVYAGVLQDTLLDRIHYMRYIYALVEASDFAEEEMA